MRATIGKELAALYEVPQDLSPDLLAHPLKRME
jgi:hypothetical protein